MRTKSSGLSWATRLAWVVASGFFTLGCASLGVRTDYDRQVVFSSFSRYAWIDSATVVRDTTASPFLERRVRRAIDRGLRERGFMADSEANPDFLVTALVIGPTREEGRWQYWPAAPCGSVVSLSFGIGYPFGYGLRHPRWPWRSPYFRAPWGYACSYRVGFGYLWLPVYEEPGARLAGTLVIDILDARTRDVIWRGSAEGAVLSDGGTQQELDDLAVRILREFPPGSHR